MRLRVSASREPLVGSEGKDVKSPRENGCTTVARSRWSRWSAVTSRPGCDPRLGRHDEHPGPRFIAWLRRSQMFIATTHSIGFPRSVGARRRKHFAPTERGLPTVTRAINISPLTRRGPNCVRLTAEAKSGRRAALTTHHSTPFIKSFSRCFLQCKLSLPIGARNSEIMDDEEFDISFLREGWRL